MRTCQIAALAVYHHHLEETNLLHRRLHSKNTSFCAHAIVYNAVIVINSTWTSSMLTRQALTNQLLLLY